MWEPLPLNRWPLAWCVLPTCPGHATPHPPERIGAYLLSALKAAAEAHIGGKVDRVVLAVPVQFDDDQIAATKRVRVRLHLGLSM